MNEIAIVGAGPAGIAASIYLKRAGIKPLIFEKERVGGLLLNANFVENYPGFPEGIKGEALVRLFYEQLSRFEIEVTKQEVKRFSFKKGRFILTMDDGNIMSRALIIATGTLPNKLGIQGESDLIGRKLFYEIKDIPQHKMEDSFVIIGGGDAAFDYALNLSKDVARVNVIFRSKKPKCLSLLEERVRKKENIHVHPETVLLSLKENENRVITDCKSDDEDMQMTSDYALIACGRTPNLNLFSKELLDTLIIREDGSTDLPGLFLAGDVRRGSFRQTGIAVGDGILCAMKAIEFLRGDESK